jgi:hypothetical protein
LFGIDYHYRNKYEHYDHNPTNPQIPSGQSR